MSSNPHLLQGLFPPEIAEGQRAVTEISGELPSFVRGTWFMNGPARFSRGDFRYRHWLDGDGLLRSIHFGDDTVTMTCRWVRSRKLIDEETAGRPLYRTFGTAFPGDRLNHLGIGIENPVNVNVVPFAGQLLAFGEQGLPYSIDRKTLATREPFTFHGALNEVSPFSAHPSVDPESGELLNFGISFSPSRPCLNLYRFSADGTLAMRRRISLPFPSSVHDFALGPRHTVVYLGPDLLDMKVILSGGTIMDGLTWRPEEGGWLLVLDRETGEQQALVPVGNRYCLHTVNCFEDSSDLVVDILELDEPVYPQYQVMPNLFRTVGPAKPVRYRLDKNSWSVTEKLTIETGMLHDFPVIDPRWAQKTTAHAWAVAISATGRPGAKFLDRLVRINWRSFRIDDAFQTPAGSFIVSEPMVVPHDTDRNRCAILCRMMNPASGEDQALVFDGHDLQSGPVAVLRLPLTSPPSLHGWWDTESASR